MNNDDLSRSPSLFRIYILVLPPSANRNNHKNLPNKLLLVYLKESLAFFNFFQEFILLNVNHFVPLGFYGSNTNGTWRHLLLTAYNGLENLITPSSHAQYRFNTTLKGSYLQPDVAPYSGCSTTWYICTQNSLVFKCHYDTLQARAKVFLVIRQAQWMFKSSSRQMLFKNLLVIHFSNVKWILY